MSHHRNRLFLSALPAQAKSSPAKAMTSADIPPPKPSTLPTNYYSYEKVDKAAVQRAEKKIYAARKAELKKLWDKIIKSHSSKTSYIDTEKLNNPACRTAAKDMNVRPAIFHMIQINPGNGDGADLGNNLPPVSLAFLRTMAAVGERRGFKVHVQYKDEEHFKNKFDNKATFLQAHHDLTSPWIEDACGFGPEGMNIPAPILLDGMQSQQDNTENDKRFNKIQHEILLKEIHRIYGPQKLTSKETSTELRQKFSLTTSGAIARIARSADHEEIHEAIHLGLASQRNIRANLTHIDGGNLFIGILKNGQRFALIGRNSVELSRALLQKQLQELYGDPTISLSDDIMRYFIAIDLGIPLPINVAFIEQPEYHLDCAMMLLNGEVLLNDSKEARALELKWSRSRGNFSQHASVDALRKKQEQAEQQNRLEEMALRDIQQQLPSLLVHRAALCFRNEFGRMNFANGEVGVDKDDKQFAVLNGGIPEAELYIRELMRTYGVEVEFVPFRESQCSLNDDGGLGCRAKCEERVDLLSALPVSPRTAGRRSLPNRAHNLFSSAASKDSPAKDIRTAKQSRCVI